MCVLGRVKGRNAEAKCGRDANPITSLDCTSSSNSQTALMRLLLLLTGLAAAAAQSGMCNYAGA